MELIRIKTALLLINNERFLKNLPQEIKTLKTIK